MAIVFFAFLMQFCVKLSSLLGQIMSQEGNVEGQVECTALWDTFYFVYSGLILHILQPGLIKIRTSVHFLCDTVLRTLLHVSPQFQREMSTEWR